MSSPDEHPPVALGDEHETDGAPVTAHRCSADRIVFTEQDNTDGWIATNRTVDVTR